LKTVLYIDNDLAAVQEIEQLFFVLGYKLIHVPTCAKAREVIDSKSIKIIVSEVDLPDGDGISLFGELRTLKEFASTLLILFSNKSDTYIQVLGLETGADDFWTKPMNKRLVQAKLKTMLARYEKGGRGDHESKFNINRDKFVVEYKGREIVLPRKEFEILNLLYYNRGKVLNREQIKDEIWTKSDKHVNARTVDVHIKNIRELIGQRFIKTIKGVGYKFNEI
jgi:two-component system alkaline phosphatase synthesis response regulator PhoP